MPDTQAAHASLNTETAPRGDLCIRTYVSIDNQGHPQVIKQDDPPISA